MRFQEENKNKVATTTKFRENIQDFLNADDNDATAANVALCLFLETKPD